MRIEFQKKEKTMLAHQKEHSVFAKIETEAQSLYLETILPYQVREWGCGPPGSR